MTSRNSLNHVLYIALIVLQLKVIAIADPYDAQPRILTQDGHMILLSGQHRNITLRTSGRGYVNINGINLLQVTTMARTASENVERIQRNVLSSLEQTVDGLSDTVNGPVGIVRRIQTVENYLRNNTPGGSRFIRPATLWIRVTSLTRRVATLERQVRQVVQRLNRNECNSNPCRNGGTCEDGYNRYFCRCQPGWEGQQCETDIDECMRLAGTDIGCQNGATCINKPGSFDCTCGQGWFGIRCTQRSDSCISTSSTALCGNGVCLSQPSAGRAHTCLCNQGWTADPLTGACTVDVDECNSNHPSCSKNPLVMCVNVPGSFHCGSCPSGYVGNGYFCSDIDECQMNNGGCSLNPHVQCLNTQGSRVCGDCPPGYQGNGVTCSYAGGTCQVNNGGCHPLATCTSVGATVMCTCPAGYAGSGIGHFGCVRSGASGNGPCDSNPCLHGSCYVSSERPDTFFCSCRPGYTGPTCSIEINPCSSSPCKNGATCFRSDVSYMCRCTANFTGRNCDRERQSCGGYLRQDQGIIRFPSSGSTRYSANMNCAWIIIVNSTKVVSLNFTSFHLERTSVACSYDWLQIHDGRGAGDHIIGRYCGITPPDNNTIVSTHNALYMWFRSDNTVSGEGFVVSWNAVDPVCGGQILVRSHGQIQFPKSSGKYPHNRDCYWYLTSYQPGKRFQLTFFTVMIESHPNCSYDYLEIRSGGSEDQLLAKYCNRTHPPPLLTIGPYAVIHFHSDESGNDAGIQIAYNLVESIPGCGGTLTGPTGVITSPAHPDRPTYMSNMDCEWLIQLPVGDRIRLSFVSFTLEDSVSCRFDYVEVRDGGTIESPLIGRYCGSALPALITSTSNLLMIYFHADFSVDLEGFRIKYETVCGGIYRNLNGILQSPFYPNNYPANRLCIYEIALPIGYAVKLSFLDFDVEVLSYPRCFFDYLEIHDGDNENSTLIGRYCGEDNEQVPPPVQSTHNYLYLIFRTDGSVSNKGFRANYSSIDILCGGILKSRTGVIQSPSHPESYPPDVECNWVISVDVGWVIQLTFLSFNLEGSYSWHGDECFYDWVELFDNASDPNTGGSMGKYCGTTLPPVMTTQGNVMTIKFKADSSNQMGGFSANYVALDATHMCSGTYRSSAGALTSPNYPRNYPLNKDCVWIIQAPTGQQIQLSVIDFQLEHNSNCAFDYLEIRNGGTDTSPLLGKFCGTSISRTMVSFSNKIYLHFKTDFSRSFRGFKILWDGTRTGCGGTVTSTTGSIFSPNYPQPYHENAECFWRISGPKGSTIHIMFIDIEMEESDACYYDYVEVRDGIDSSGKQIGRYCRNPEQPISLFSSTNHVFVKFRSDFSNSGKGFHLRFNSVCNVVVKGYRGVIESSNFPQNYAPNSNCMWNITATMGNKINMSFSHFELEGGVSYMNDACSYDYVEIKEGQGSDPPTQNVGRFCGNTLPSPVASTLDTVYVHFVSDSSLQYSGFRLEWVLNGCGGHFERPYGTFSSPNYPNHYNVSTVCEWILTVELGKSVQLVLQDFSMEKAPNCYYDSLTIFGGPDDTSPQLGQLCMTQKTPVIYTSSGNNMYVRFVSDFSFTGRGFQAHFTTINSACGGIMKAPVGQIHSKNYPNNYDDSDDCEWYIVVDKKHVIKLTFIDFSMEVHINCSYDYLKVYDGNSTDSPLLLTHCGRNVPTVPVVKSTGNRMFLRMKADGSGTARGFLANYTISCGARIVANEDDYGVISLNDVIDMNNENKNCSWIITGQNTDDRIYLTINHIDQTYLGDEGCNIFGIEIRDGDDKDAPLIGRYCAKGAPPTIISQGSALFVEAVSLYGLGGSSFSATYSVLSTACGGNLSSEYGSVASPGYPNNYPVNAECVWIINTAPGNQVQLGFKTFHLGSSCNEDYLEIRKNNGIGPLIGIFCGSTIPSNLTASHKLWLKFRSSDAEATAGGFFADFSMIHGNDLNGTSGQVASPLYPRPYLREADYSWRITVEFGSAISITFQDFYLASIDSCDGLSLTIYDGFDQTAPVIKTVCGPQMPDSLTSSSNIVYIRFLSYGAWQGSWFLLSWLQVERPSRSIVPTPPPSVCGGIVAFPQDLNFTSYNITSPGYPQNYEDNLNCEWIIEAPPSFHLSLKFNQLKIEESPDCMLDYVQVFKGENGRADWTDLGRFCLPSTAVEDPLVSTSLMKVVFHSDFSRSDTGFSAAVNLECGGLLTEPSGNINAYNLSGRGLHTPQWGQHECEWIVTVRTGRTIAVTFDVIDIQASDTNVCTEGYLMLKNGGSAASPFLGKGKYCGTMIPTVNQTTGNMLYVKYSTRGAKLGFKLRYQEVSITCGDQIIIGLENSFTMISSPRYPQIPHPFTECEWTVMAPAGERMRIDFIGNFDVQCANEMLELYDGGTRNARLIGSYCSNTPSSQFTTDNVLYIHYFTNTTLPHNGFKTNISLASCGGTLRGYRGTILSPSYPGSYSTKLDCEWRIVGTLGHYLTFTFVDFQLDYQPNCSGDSVSINQIIPLNNSVSELGKWCGTLNSQVIQAAGNEAKVSFHSGATTGRFGENHRFKISYASSHESCGGVFNTPDGIITSPNYPYSLMYRRYCIWTIKVPKGRRITAQFLDFDLGGDNYSPYVSFYSDLRFRTTLAVFRPTSVPVTVESPSNLMRIYYGAYHTSNVGRRGFKLSYTSDKPSLCGGDLVGSTGIISFPVADFNFTSYFCEWERVPPETHNETLALNFINATVGATSDSYQQSYIEILKGDVQLLRLRYNISVPTIVASPFISTKIQVVRYELTTPVSFTMRYSSHRCGGILSGPEDVITSPNYPGNYPPDTHCAWLINYPDGQAVKIHFDSLNIEPVCGNDYLLIFTGPSLSSPQMPPFCGNTVPSDVTVLSSKFLIEFHSNTQVQSQGFKLTVQPVTGGCGGILHDINRELSSPNFPQKYTNNAECTWDVIYKQGYTLQLNFVERFFLEESPNCENDFVEAFDNVNDNWVSLGKVCGPNAPRPFKSTSNKMRVMFRSNGEVVHDGFKARFSTNCGGIIANSSEGVIVTPGYPAQYSGGLRCNYTFIYPDKYAEIRFLSFGVEKGFRDCRFDNVTVLVPEYQWQPTQMRTLGVYCGYTAPPTIREMNRIEIIFKTDETVNKQGFMLKYEVEKCGGNVTMPQEVKVLNLKYSYTRKNCTWTITAPRGKSVTVRFLKFKIEYHASCQYDAVKVFDDNVMNAKKLLGTYCGDLTANLPVMRSSTRYLTMQLVTDGSMPDEGIIAAISFSNVCGGNFNVTSQPMTIRYPRSGAYDTFEHCVWMLAAPVGQVIETTITTMNIAQCSNGSRNSSCDCDFIEFRDGGNQFSGMIGRYCGSSLPRLATTSSNKLWILFASDGSDSSSGFEVRVRSVASLCGTERFIVNSSVQQLTSPNYPADYPINIRCTWLLTVPRTGFRMWPYGGHIHIRFIDLDLETGGKYCTNDRLEITDSEETGIISEGLGESFVYSGARNFPTSVYFGARFPSATGTYCGRGHPHDYFSNSDAVRLTFTSNSNVTAKGFKLQFSSSVCNRTYTGVQGRIKITEYAVPSTDCNIVIQAQPNHTISLYFLEFSMRGSRDCTQQYLQVRDGTAQNSPVLAKICGYQTPPPIFSNTSAVRLYKNNDALLASYHIDITYTTTDQGPGCGGPIFNYGGTFTSPLYPNSYRKASQCRWDIMVPALLRPVLRFQAFDLGSRRTCETDFIEFFDVDPETKVQSFRTRYCGDDNPAIFEGTTSHTVVRYTTSINNGGTGWVIVFMANSPGTTVRNF